ncbi:MAG TPA: hypothetical protein VGD58_23365 [Herpetosiphonaceae bacterium]
MKQHRHRPLTLTCWLIIITLSLVIWPKLSNAAQATVKLADSNQSWSNGRFFRTGLAASEVGGVQLVPMKVLTTWKTTSTLPAGLSQHTSATYGSRIFVVGGNKLEGQELVKTDSFFTTKLRQGQLGQLEDWIGQTGDPGETVLPPLPIRLSDTESLVVEVGGKAYLLVLGGQLGEGNLDDVTTAEIYSYEISENANGQIIPKQWQTVASRLPHEPDYDESGVGRGSGARNLSAITLTVAGEQYIYLFGGWSRTFIGGSYYDEFFSDVYRAKISAGSTRPTIDAWEEVSDIRGLYEGMVQDVPLAGAATVTFVDPADGSTGVYLIGGTNANNEYEANAYIAKINVSNAGAAIQWLDNGNMTETRIGHGAVQAKGSITVSGGSLNAESPSTSLARGYIMDDLELYRPQENAANFDLTQGALVNARMFHTMETLRDNQDGKDYAYIIGGKVQINQNTQDPASPQVLVGDLDETPQDTDSFVSDGKYYSKVFDFGEQAEYYSLSWTTLISDGQDIDMQFRVGNDPQNMGAIEDIPVAAQPGRNTYSYTFNPAKEARYFQFIATLKASSVDRRSSPVLDKVALDVKRIGFPNVRVPLNGASFAPSTIDASTTNITPLVALTNQAFDAQHPALDADWDAPGTFFVDIYVTPPGVTPAPPQLGTVGVAWAEVNKSLMKANMTDPYVIPSTNWRPGSCVTGCNAMNWRSVFTTVGVYNVYVMVDSSDNPAAQFGNLVESETTTTAGETDNVFGPFQVEVTEFSDLRIFVPTVMAPPATGVAQQSAPVLPRYRVHTIGDSQ